MTSIIPSLPARPANPTIVTSIGVAPPYTISAGQVYYTYNRSVIYVTDPDPLTNLFVTNDGTIWTNAPSTGPDIYYYPSDNYAFQGWRLNNTGNIIAEVTRVVLADYMPPQGAQAFGAYNIIGLNNTGTIGAIGYQLSAVGVSAATGYTGNISNSGTIYAQASYTAGTTNNGIAIGVEYRGTAHIINEIGGQILAEGPKAIGIRGVAFFYDSITNHGLIEAHSTDPSVKSVGIYLGGATITNDGTIHADQAINGVPGSMPVFLGLADESVSPQTINNLAGGVIQGDILLFHGNDSLNNSGSITGLVDMGLGNDAVDTRSGTVTGLIDLGWGNDTLEGSSLADIVQGGVGNDWLRGYGGADLLLGGFGRDFLDGYVGDGGSADRLYGETGNDTFWLSGGDFAYGGSHDDDFTSVGDTQFAMLDGGDGYDIWRLSIGPLSIDLAQVAASGRVLNIEEIDLGTNRVSVHSADVAALTGGGETLILHGAPTSKVNLVGQWTLVGSVLHGSASFNGSASFTRYTSNGVNVDVADSIVEFNASSLGGGLDAIPVGDIAPLPGSIAGSDLSNGILTTSNVSVEQDLTIETRESFIDTGAYYNFLNLLMMANLVNKGTISSTASNGNNTAIFGNTTGGIQNYGLIEASSVGIGSSIGIDGASLSGDIINYGDITAQATNGDSWAVRTVSGFNNSGFISAISQNSVARGFAKRNSGSIFNSGTIEALGGFGAFGISSSASLISLNNSGTVTAIAAPDSHFIPIAISLSSARIDNSGSITAELAIDLAPYNPEASIIDNSGVINGVISYTDAYLTYGQTTFTLNNQAGGQIFGPIFIDGATGSQGSVTNAGLIDGDVYFGNGDDVFDGSAGILSGIVDGGAGNDHIIGNADSNYISGGSGNDILDGGDGDDVASYVTSANGVTLDLRVSSVQNTGGAGLDTLVSIENIDGSEFNDTLTGNDRANIIVGGDGNDHLLGGLGIDTLVGGSGFDVLVGGGGLDRFEGTIADLNGDVISDMSLGESINISNAALGGFAFSWNGTQLGIGASTVTLNGLSRGHFKTQAGPMGGVDMIWAANAVARDVDGNGTSDVLYYSASDGRIGGLAMQNGANAGVIPVVGDPGSGAWGVQASGDFNADGTADVALKNSATGQFYLWTIANGHQTGGRSLGTIGTSWDIRSAGDYNGDGNSDILWRDSSNGHLYVWNINTQMALSGSTSLGVIGTNWDAGQSGDFDGDGDSDVLLRNSDNGHVYIFEMQNGLVTDGHSMGVFGTDWILQATGDYNGDGRGDIALKNTASGQFYSFLMHADYSATGNNIGTIGTDWNIAASGDYNGDGTDDILWRNATTGQLYQWQMDNTGHQASGNHTAYLEYDQWLI